MRYLQNSLGFWEDQRIDRLEKLLLYQEKSYDFGIEHTSTKSMNAKNKPVK